VPLSHQAEPGTYKILSEDEYLRVALATWKPGQRDKFHLHPIFAAYSLTDCHRRLYKPEDTFDEKQLKAGSSRVFKPVASHSFENVGKTECRTLLIERKKWHHPSKGAGGTYGQ
jgi:mannose-6-phosphate isomerase-like protein (cupin superfamily)